MYEVMQNPGHVALWHAASRGEAVDWVQFMDGFSAAVDWPASAFWPELSAVFPEAIIVLSERDSEKWWASARDTIFPRILDEPTTEERKEWIAMIHSLLGTRFTMDLQNKEACIAAFEAHNANVRKTAPAERLVVWQASDGWGPLCQGLGLPIPDEPFPVANTKEEFLERVKAR